MNWRHRRLNKQLENVKKLRDKALNEYRFYSFMVDDIEEKIKDRWGRE